MRTVTGSLVLARGHEVSLALIERLRSYGQRVGVIEPFRVLVQVQLNAPRPPTLTPPWYPRTIASTEENNIASFIRVNPQPRGEYENAYRRWLGGGF